MLLYFQYVQKIHTHVQKIIFVKKVRLNRKRKILIVEEHWVAPFETKNWLRIQYLILTFSSSFSFLIRYFKNLSGHKCDEFRRKIGMCLYFITSYWHYVISFFVVWSFFIHTEKMILLIVKRIQWCTPQRRFGTFIRGRRATLALRKDYRYRCVSSIWHPPPGTNAHTHIHTQYTHECTRIKHYPNGVRVCMRVCGAREVFVKSIFVRSSRREKVTG